jgi:TRAP-type mannitol/chloroaromatic compound transport system permease large subunit
MLIAYSAAASVSVVRLYAAATLPGFLLASLYIAYVVTRVIFNPKLAPKLRESESNVPWSEAALLLAKAFVPLAVLILAVLGSIIVGLATPTEAASIGALGSLVLAAAYRALT